LRQGRGRRVHRGRRHRPGRAAAGQYQRRRPVLRASGHVRRLHHDRGGAAIARRLRRPPGGQCAPGAGARQRRHAVEPVHRHPGHGGGAVTAAALPARIHHLLQDRAARQPDAVFLYEEDGGTLSYGAMWRRVERARDWLAAQAVRPGDRVAVVGENCAEMVQALFACSLLGAWPVGLNARLSAREVEVIRRHAEPALTLYTSRVSPAAAAHAQAAGARPADAAAWGPGNHWAPAEGRPAPERGELAGQVATLIYTSGTTGAPKGVMVPHRGLLHFARISAASRRLAADDIGYAALPLSHIFGIATVLMATIHAGASLVVRSRYDAQDVLRALESPGISILQGVPTMFTRLLAAAPERP